MQHDFILLDRSGSMASMWVEALSSIDAYVAGLAEKHVKTQVTLAVFDNHYGELDFKVLRDSVSPTEWESLSDKEAAPRGGTPLNDAIGKLIFLANIKPYTRACIIIMTDGAENMSREDRSGAVARKLLDDCRSKEWPVIFLGVAYEPKAHTTMAVGTYNNDVFMTASAAGGQMVNSTRRMSEKRATYGKTGQAATMSFSPDEKDEMSKPPEAGNGPNQQG